MKSKVTVTPAPTLEDRLNSANATASAALNVFEQASIDLVQAAGEMELLAADAKEEELRLQQLGAFAAASAERSHKQASHIRSLILGEVDE